MGLSALAKRNPLVPCVVGIDRGHIFIEIRSLLLGREWMRGCGAVRFRTTARKGNHWPRDAITPAGKSAPHILPKATTAQEIEWRAAAIVRAFQLWRPSHGYAAGALFSGPVEHVEFHESGRGMQRHSGGALHAPSRRGAVHAAFADEFRDGCRPG